MRVVDLAARQTVSRPAISRHLRLLTEAGLLEVEQRGRERHYAIRAEPLRRVREYVDGVDAPTQATGLAPGLATGLASGLATGVLDALDTEVRRTSRDRRSGGRSGSRSTATREDIA